MRRSAQKILTTHVGALPGPPEAWEGEAGDAALRAAVNDVVAAQLAAGTDLVNEGELTKGGNWVTFINSRLAGFVGVPAEGTLALLRSSADWQEFDDFYAKAMAGGTLFEQTASAPVQTSRVRDWVCREPIRYTGQDSLRREIESLKSALGKHPVGDAFLTSTAPASVEVGRKNEHYESDEEFVYAARRRAQGRIRDDREGRSQRTDRRRVAARALGSHRHQNGAAGVSALLHVARRGAQSRARQRARGAGALSPLLG